MMNNEEKALVRYWFKQKKQLEELTLEVANLETEIMDTFFSEMGTYTVPVDENFRLRYIEERAVRANTEAVAKKEGLLRQGGFIGNGKLLEPNYEVNMHAFNNLSEQDRLAYSDIFTHACITIPVIEKVNT